MIKMALSDLYNTQPSEANMTTTTSDPFGLKEKAKEAFKNQTGTSWENASQQDIQEARSQQFNPILEATGAVNDDGSVNNDVMENVTVQPGENTSEDTTPVIGGTNTGGLPSYISTGTTDGNEGENPINPMNFMPFSGLMQKAAQQSAQTTAQTFFSPLKKLMPSKNQDSNNSSQDGLLGKIGFLEKTMILTAVLILGPSIIKALSEDK